MSDRNPEAVIFMKNGAQITIELLYKAAPNTVNSFIYAASQHIFDHFAIQRIVPGNWIDISYTGFGKKAGQYLIPSEFELNSELHPLPVKLGSICMGGYGSLGLAGCEFFFPVRDCPELTGIYPVFGYIRSGMDEIYRLEHVRTVPVRDYPYAGVEINKPVEPQLIDHVELHLHGLQFDAPIMVSHHELPLCWK